MYVIEVTRAEGSREIVQRLRTRHDALTWIDRLGEPTSTIRSA